MENGSRPPDDTLIDTLSMMKNMLAQAQNKPSRAEAAAAAKQKAVKNIQKKLTQNILKKLDNDQPMVEVAKKLKVLQSFQPYIQDMERRMAILKQVEPVLEQAIKTLTQVIDIKGMMPKPKPKEPELPPPPKEEDPTSQVDLAALLKQAMG